MFHLGRPQGLRSAPSRPTLLSERPSQIIPYSILRGCRCNFLSVSQEWVLAKGGFRNSAPLTAVKFLLPRMSALTAPLGVNTLSLHTVAPTSFSCSPLTRK